MARHFYNSRNYQVVCLNVNICYYFLSGDCSRTRWPGCVAQLDVTMFYPLVPYDPLPAAVAYSQRFVLNRKSVGQTPYANAFFRHLTGGSVINSAALRRLIPLYNPKAYRSISKTSIIEALDTAIATRGAIFPLPLPLDLQDKLFPYLAHRKEQRTLHHIGIHLDRNRKVANKRKSAQQAAYDTEVERAWEELNTSTKPSIGTWYRRWCEREVNGGNLTDNTFRSLLARWHKAHTDSDWSWNDLYYAMPTWRVVLDMQSDPDD